jgi:hypothetical protein
MTLRKCQFCLTGFPDFGFTKVSLRAIFEQSNDVELLKEIVPKLVKYFDWWKGTRDIDKTGLVTIIHPWESGIDLSPAYDPALGVPARMSSYRRF